MLLMLCVTMPYLNSPPLQLSSTELTQLKQCKSTQMTYTTNSVY